MHAPLLVFCLKIIFDTTCYVQDERSVARLARVVIEQDNQHREEVKVEALVKGLNHLQASVLDFVSKLPVRPLHFRVDDNGGPLVFRYDSRKGRIMLLLQEEIVNLRYRDHQQEVTYRIDDASFPCQECHV